MRRVRCCVAGPWLAGQVLTDNGKVFTGRFNTPPVEVRFDRDCRENGIEHPDVLQGSMDGCLTELAAQAAASLGNYL